MQAKELIEKLNLKVHPEGGYFCETYRSNRSFELPYGHRSASTGIYFLLEKGQRSHLHRIKSDELWHFYLGGPLKIVELDSSGNYKETILGADLNKGYSLQYCVAAGNWFGAEPIGESDFCLVGCTVAPGFDFADFEMASQAVINEVDQSLSEKLNSFILK